MKGFLKRVLCALMAVMMLFALTACNESNKNIVQDASELTMFIGLGNTGSGYYDKLRDALYKETGIKLQFVYYTTVDVSNAMLLQIANNDTPADIVVTAAAVDADICEKSFLDLAAYTNVPDQFTSVKIQSVSKNGKVYQLPFTSRLIGIEYNKTLMQEMGWQVPKTISDMKELKAKAEAAGYKFAVSGGVATGHGMNYLFHLMGSEYLSTPNGSQWLENFQSGKTDISAFAEKCAYFKEYVEAGLFGSYHSGDWNAKTEFSRERALFYYNIINDIDGYDGFRYNADGTLYGASYDENGTVIAVEDANGSAVLSDGEYVLYDADNEQHANLTRYTIPGAVVLHDTYATMPWITSGGSANCFTSYDNMLVALNKRLTDSKQADRLKQAEKVLMFMTGKTAADIFCELYPDGYVAVKGFTVDESRIYYDSADAVTGGYLMPWYYNDFDMDSIVNVGQRVNNYIQGLNGDNIETVLQELDARNQAHLNKTEEYIAEVTEEFDYPDLARLEATAAMNAAQKALDAAGIAETVTAAIMPHLETAQDITDCVSLAIAQVRLYKGGLQKSLARHCINTKCEKQTAIRMKGSQLKILIKNGFNSEELGYEHTFPYAYVLKDGGEIKDDVTYVVAVAESSVAPAVYKQLDEAGQVIKQDGKAVTGGLEEALMELFEEKKTLSPKDF